MRISSGLRGCGRTVGSPRTHKRRRQRHARRDRLAAEAAEVARWQALSPLQKVLEAKASERRAASRLSTEAMMDVVTRTLTPSVVDSFFRTTTLMAALRARR